MMNIKEEAQDTLNQLREYLDSLASEEGTDNNERISIETLDLIKTILNSGGEMISHTKKKGRINKETIH